MTPTSERLDGVAFDGHVDALRDLTRRAPGGVVLDAEGVTCWAGAHDFPVLVNGAARVDARCDGAEVVARARAFFTPRGRGFSLYTLDGRDDDVRTAAAVAGLVAVREAAPLMARFEPGDPIEAPSGVALRRVNDGEGVADLARVVADAYSVYGMPADVGPTVLADPAVVLAPHVAAFVAYDDGPVATAMAIATGGTAYVAWVGTVTRAQRRGLGASVTQAATIAGFGLGARTATLLASPMGAPVYRRMGWQDVGSLTYQVESMPRA